MFIINRILSVSLAILLCSCNSGVPNSNENQSPKRTLPLGPISYTQVNDFTGAPITLQLIN